jgi:ribonuclease BN (tRNA processing enzyme)
MIIEFLGVGSGLSPELGNNNVLLTSEKSDRKVLIDCGFSTPPELSKRQDLQNITDILITHLHSDHIGGLELVALTSFYVHRIMNPDSKKITLHLPTKTLKDRLWHSLKNGMESAQTVEDGYFKANLENYFDINTGKDVNIDGFDTIRYQSTNHVKNMEAYSIWLKDAVYYSADTIELPPKNADLIFQDCQLFESPTSVHASFSELNEGMDAEQKSKTWLMHYGFNANGVIPEDHGFQGFVKRYQKFDV